MLKLVNIAQTLLTRSASRGKHVPLIHFPDRRALKQQQQQKFQQQSQTQTVASPAPQSPKLNKNAVYIDFTKAPKRLAMRNDEMDIVMSGGAY